VLLCSVLVLSVGMPAVSGARQKRQRTKAPATLDSRDLTPGMKGYGLTVMRGTKIERFQIEIIGVLHNKLPQQDMIMIKCSGLNLEHSGIIAGMSGSPIYVVDPKRGDLLIGALSYGYGFNKDPVAGVTPIAAMLPELRRPRLPMPPPQRLADNGQSRKKVKAHIAGYGVIEMQPVAIPLSVAGFHPEVVQAIDEELAGEGFHVLRASGGGSSTKPSPPMQPGSAMSLVLVRGDMSIAGIGTVTWVDGDRFVAFGHPFKGLGQVHLPIGGAHIVWVLSSQMLSFKMGYPLRSTGVLDQDRQPCVAGRIGPKARMVPMQVTVIGKRTGTTRNWNVELTDQPTFFPLATAVVMANALKVSEPIASDAVVKLELTYDLGSSHAPVVIKEHIVSLGGTSRMGTIVTLARKASKLLVYNGFERLAVERVHAKMVVDRGRPFGFLEALRTATEEVDVGDRVRIEAEFLLPNHGKETIELLLPPIPKDLAGEKVSIWVGPERMRAPERPNPENISDLLRDMRSFLPKNRLAAVIALPERTWMVRGKRLTDLPLGVRDELARIRRKTRRGKQTMRVGKTIPWVINGHGTVSIQVRAQQ
jgi:hypothetical protein